MKFAIELLAILLFVTTAYSSKDRNNKPYKVVCYWGSWTFYRQGDGKFLAEDANPNICTHMVYGFTKLEADNTIGVFDTGLDIGDTNWNSGLQWGHGMYRRFNNLRTYNKHLTTMIAIGGWNEGSDKYSRMVSNPSSRQTFVNSCVKFLQKYDFDGLDLDWEYPAMAAVGDQDRKPTGNAADKQNFIALIKELKDAFKPHGFLLSAAVSAGKPTIDRAYDVPQMSKYLDMINLMSYDFHGGWEQKTAHNAPLYPRPNDNQLDKEFTTAFAVEYWIKLGADPKKIIMGMPLYARTFTLSSPNNFGIGAPAVGAGGTAGPLTKLVGILGYHEVCQLLKQGYKVHREETQKVPFAVGGNQWLGYDDEESLKEKVRYLKSKGLGGGMVWSIDTDDFRGRCGNGKYPLLKTISKELNGGDGPDVNIPETHATPAPTGGPQPETHRPDEPQTDAPPATQSPGGTFKCTSGGFHPDPNDKTIFHECVPNGNGNFQDIVYRCGPGTVWKNKALCGQP